MSVQGIPRQQIDADIGRFTAEITGERERWSYCFDRMSYNYTSKRTGHTTTEIAEKGKAAAARIINSGITPRSTLYYMRRLRTEDFDALNVWSPALDRKRLSVGALPAWCVGHVYFLRVVTHPHVIKVGFSRRVNDRIDEIRSHTKVPLQLVGTQVGTLLDEQKWHRDLAGGHIEGEWFFVRRSVLRTLPDFLAKAEAA